MNRRLRRFGVPLVLSALAVVAVGASDRGRRGDPAPDVGTSYRVPYHVTDTNHYLVRARINGKGPFNFLVDTGAPALYIATDTAKQIGLEPSRTSYWTDVERIEFEGGAVLSHMKSRIEDPFQLVGMNALGLPGASIDGILGFTVLARYRIELDPTSDRMVWTRLDFEPKEPFVPADAAHKEVPADVKALDLLGPVAKMFAALGFKQPEAQVHPSGFLGLELEEADGAVKVSGVLADGPAAQADLKPGDRLERINGRRAGSLDQARAAVAEVRPGQRVPLTIRRGDETHNVTLIAGEGF